MSLFFMHTSSFLRKRRVGSRLMSSYNAEKSSLMEKFDSLLWNCEDYGHLKKIHACIFTYGLGNNVYLGTKLLNCYAAVGGLQDSRWVFQNIVNPNPSLWSSAVAGYFRTGYFNEVLKLLLNLKLRGIYADSGAVTFGLKSSAILRNNGFGTGLHADVLKVGLNRDKFVGSSLVGMYSEIGSLDDVHKAFEEISKKDVVAYTTIITAYSQATDYHTLKAFNAVNTMQKEGLDPNRITLVSLVQAAGRIKAYREGCSIHCYAIRRGIGNRDEVFETSLLDMYIRCGARNSAMLILINMKERHVPSWNVMIAGLVRSGQPLEALRVFGVMKQDENVVPDVITLTNLLLACNDSNCTHLVTSIQACIIRRGIPPDLVLTTCLIDTYFRFHNLHKAKLLFDELESRDVVCYNVMISGYLQNGSVAEAIDLVQRMVKEHTKPNSATILTLLSGFADVADIRRGKCVHGFVLRHDLHSAVDVSNQLLHVYAKCGSIRTARATFDSMNEKDLVSWTSMMMGYVNCGHADEALALFQLMQRVRERPDSITLVSLLQALQHLGCLKEVKQIHGFIYRIQLGMDIIVLNSLMMTYSKCGRLDTAGVLFNTMSERELASWNTMISAFGMHGRCQEAIELFYQMQRKNVKPDEATFTSLLSACSHAGQIEDAWRFFHLMSTEYFFNPNEEHYSCMVDLLARAGHLQEAFTLTLQFPLENSTTALSALLSACRVHGNTELGEVVAKKLLELDPHNPGNYALASSMCTDTDKWNKVAMIRLMARDAGLQKMPGYSLIELEKL